MRDVDPSDSVSSDSKSDDEAPESLPTRPKTALPLPPPPRKADPTKHCKYYSTGGTCGKKGKCRFVHDPSVREAALNEREMNGGRMTLQQRLILNDKEQEDLTIVKTIQYLKDKGAYKDLPSAADNDLDSSPVSGSNGQSHLPPPPVKREHKSLPAQPHPSLPPQPPPSVHATPRVPYEGWNLSGFGNTGVKSEDL